MKNKGFTLIELLAVIVILAIIALIAIPIVLNIIDTSKRGALKDSAYGIIEATEIFYANEITKGNTVNPTFTVVDNKFILDSDETTELSFKGEVPKLGNVGVNGKKTYIRITDGSYCAYKSIDDLDVNVIKGNCSDISSTGYASGSNVSVGGSNPAGTIIAYYGNTAPTGYLKCDGSEYDISDYPDLAALILATTGSYGTETSGKFKVPDLQGEFLRGTGTNSHANQGSGGNVGEHQNATLLSKNWVYSGSTIVAESIDNTIGATNADSTITATSKYRNVGASSGTRSQSFATTRPTNTSVLYCIKY